MSISAGLSIEPCSVWPKKVLSDVGVGVLVVVIVGGSTGVTVKVTVVVEGGTGASVGVGVAVGVDVNSEVGAGVKIGVGAGISWKRTPALISSSSVQKR